MKQRTTIPCTCLDREPATPIYFLSDTHLSTSPGAQSRERMRDVLALLDEIRQDGGTLMIVGDFFDFWFDCRNYVHPVFKPVVEKLKELRKQGIEVHYLGGNHDHWIPGYLTQETGLRYYPEALTFRQGGKHFYCVHGDQVVYNNRLYPMLRRFMHAPAAIALLKILPAAAIYRLGEYVSHYNRALDRIPRVPDKIVGLMEEFLAERLREGYDIAVCGHVHRPRFLEDGRKKIRVILGDWIHHRSYGFWDGSVFRLIEKT